VRRAAPRPKLPPPPKPKPPKTVMADVRASVEIVPAWEPPLATRVTIHDLEGHHCRWPLGDPATAEFRYCGCSKVEGLPYCAEHAVIAFRPADAGRNSSRGGQTKVGGGVTTVQAETAAGGASKREMEDA